MALNDENNDIIISSEVFLTLVDECLKLWPGEIDVTEKKILANNRMKIPSLKKAEDKVEEYILAYEEKSNRYWFHKYCLVVNELIYELLHEQANKHDKVRPKDIVAEDLLDLINNSDHLSNIYILNS